MALIIPTNTAIYTQIPGTFAPTGEYVLSVTVSFPSAGSLNVKCAIYSGATEPTLVVAEQSFAPITSPGNYSVFFDLPAQLNATDSFWFALAADADVEYDPTSNPGFTSSTDYTAFPASHPVVTSHARYGVTSNIVVSGWEPPPLTLPSLEVVASIGDLHIEIDIDLPSLEVVVSIGELHVEIDIDLPSLEVMASIGDVRTKVLAPMLAMDDLVVEGDFHPTSTNFVSMRYSNNGGLNWSEARMQPLGGIGEFQTSIQFRNLGQSRNKLIELSWSAQVNTSLSGATIQVETSET